MRIKSAVIATAAESGVVLLEGLGENLIHLLGSTLPTSMDGKKMEVTNSLSIALEKGQTGLLALISHTPPNSPSRSSNFFLEVAWPVEKDKPHIDLEKQWVPTDGARLPQIVDEHIEVLVDGQIFSSELRFKGNPEHRYVSGNAICRYVLGEISADELAEEATKRVAKQDVCEALATTNKVLATTNKKLREAYEALDTARRINDGLQKTNDEDRVNLGRYQSALNKVWNLTMSLDHNNNHRWRWWPLCYKQTVVKEIHRIISDL